MVVNKIPLNITIKSPYIILSFGAKVVEPVVVFVFCIKESGHLLLNKKTMQTIKIRFKKILPNVSYLQGLFSYIRIRQRQIFCIL